MLTYKEMTFLFSTFCSETLDQETPLLFFNQETPSLLQTPATIFTQTVAIFASENKFNLSSEKHRIHQTNKLNQIYINILTRSYPNHSEVNEWCKKACGKC